MNKKHNKYGFTIVELLIVIVVIAILAIIAIIVFRGIIDRANNSKTANAVSQLARAIKAYDVSSTRPFAADYFENPSNVVNDGGCLADKDDAVCNISPDGQTCFTPVFPGLDDDEVTGKVQPNGDFAKIIRSFPGASDQKIKCNTSGATASGATFVAFRASSGASAYYITYITFYLKGDVSCPKIPDANVTKQFKQEATRCVAALTTS